jgi:hypothetical protein
VNWIRQVPMDGHCGDSGELFSSVTGYSFSFQVNTQLREDLILKWFSSHQPQYFTYE